MTETDLLSKHKNTLGVSRGDGVAEVKKKARLLLMKFHPDRNPANRAHCEEKVKEIITAYKAVLSHAASAENNSNQTNFRGQGNRSGSDGSDSEERDNSYGSGAGEDFDAESDSEILQCLSFEIAGRKFALPMSKVRSVLRAEDIRISDIGIFEDALPFAAGAFTLGREVALLWNLHKQLSFAEPPITSRVGKSKIIVIDADGSPIGFIVNEIGAMIDIDFRTVAPAVASDECFGNRIVSGVADVDNKRCFLLDVEEMAAM